MPLSNFDFPGVTYTQTVTQTQTQASGIADMAVACVGPLYAVHRAGESDEAVVATSASYTPASPPRSLDTSTARRSTRPRG